MNNSSNQYFLDELRSNSCYPTFRAVVSIATYVLYAAAVVTFIFSLSSWNPLVGLVVAVLITVLAKVVQEVSLMVADIADTTIFSANKLKSSNTAISTQFESSLTATPPVNKSNASPSAKIIKNLDDDDYRFFLVDKFKISKNDVLSKFILDGKTFDSLDEALKAAMLLDSPIKPTEINDIQDALIYLRSNGYEVIFGNNRYAITDKRFTSEHTTYKYSDNDLIEFSNFLNKKTKKSEV